MTRSQSGLPFVAACGIGICGCLAFGCGGSDPTPTQTTPPNQECSPGAKLCEGMVARLCDAKGIWNSGTTCQYVCRDGDCAGECTPAATGCTGSTPRECDSTGTWHPGQPCAYGCSNGKCVSQCSPGSKQCNGLIPQTCDAGGTWQDGSPCPSFGGTASCNAGECSLQCGTVNGVKYDDCNHNLSDGCETSLASTANCGACGNACPSSHGTPSCSSGQCELSCAAGYANCNKDFSDGCEVDTTQDIKNCGACGSACSTLNATPTCAAGVCKLACNMGFGDCNSDPSDGCECSHGILDSGFATTEVDSIAADDTNVFVATHYDQYYLRRYPLFRLDLGCVSFEGLSRVGPGELLKAS